MKKAYRMFKRADRGGVYYIQENGKNNARSLKTTDETEAQRLLDAKNGAVSQTAALNLQIGKAYITNANPDMAKRTWETAMDELSTHGKESSQKRCSRAFEAKAFDLIRNNVIIETTAEDLMAVLRRGGAATSNYLRRLHNLALDNGWLQWQLISSKKWGKPVKRLTRAISSEEHQRIIAAERNIERRHYYELLWLIGAAQTDGSLLTDANIDWKEKVISYKRKKTSEWSLLSIGHSLETLLKKLPKLGFLFPKIATLSDKHRAAEFYRRCRLLGIKGVSLHSYRRAWAERAYIAGYPERYPTVSRLAEGVV
jgi:integrase